MMEGIMVTEHLKGNKAELNKLTKKYYDVIEAGMRFKNYKELCKHLEEKELAGNQKKLQLEKWSLFFKWNKEGHQYIIKEVFENPKSKIAHANSRYVKEIEIMLNDFLKNVYIKGNVDDCYINKNTCGAIVTLPQLLVQLGLVNEIFSFSSNKKEATSSVLNIDDAAFTDMYNIAKNEFKAIVERAFSSLKKRKIAMVKDTMVICYKNYDQKPDDDLLYEYDEVLSRYIDKKYDEQKMRNCSDVRSDKKPDNKSDNKKSVLFKKYKEATNHEISLILTAQKKALESLNMNSLYSILASKNKNLYYEYIERTMRGLPENWLFVYSAYNIIYGDLSVLKGYIPYKENPDSKMGIEMIESKILPLQKVNRAKKKINREVCQRFNSITDEHRNKYKGYKNKNSKNIWIKKKDRDCFVNNLININLDKNHIDDLKNRIIEAENQQRIKKSIFKKINSETRLKQD